MDLFGLDAKVCPHPVIGHLAYLAQAAIGLWIWSVWSWRLRMETSFRGLGSKNLVQEFATYGFGLNVFKAVGIVKVSCASLLVFSVVYPTHFLVLIGGSGMVVLMSVAVLSHFKVGDELVKYGAASAMLFCSLYVIFSLGMGCIENWPMSMDFMRSLIGAGVIAGCSAMCMRSYLEGDYDINNYDLVEPMMA